MIGAGALWFLAGLGAALVGAALWIRRTFGPVSVDQMLMNLGGGGTDAPDGYLWGFVWQAVLVPLGLLVLAWVICRVVVGVVTHRLTQSHRSFAVPSAKAVKVRHSKRIARRLVVTGAAVATFAVGAAVFGQAVGAAQFVRSLTTPLTMDKYYVAPEVGALASTVAAHDSAPKNLVVIYLESGEESFSDESLFEFNMNEPLETATADWEKFDQLDMYDGGGWTMAGIVGTECGVPLRGPGIGMNDINSNEIGADSSEYMPNAVCLGDVLSAAGYTNVFLGGADASFASKGNFLESHGYDEVHDLSTWKDLGETEMSSWGLSDRRLMERAKEEVTRLHEAGQPFHMSMLTVDTHEPVFVHEYCPIESQYEMPSVVRCSMEQVAGFVDYMRAQGYLEDTAVMITGDHPKMLGEGAAFYTELSPLDERPLFNRLWDPDGAVIQRSSIDQLSVYATLLDILDLSREDGRAGVGVSALVPADSSVGALALSDEEYTVMIESRSSELYRMLWNEGSHEHLEVAGK